MNNIVVQNQDSNHCLPFTPAPGYDTVYLGKDIASLSSLNHLKINPGLMALGNLGLQGCALVVLGGLLLKNARCTGTATAYAQAILRVVQGVFQVMGGALYAASSLIKSSGRKLADTFLTKAKGVSTVASKVRLASRINFALGGLFFALGFGVELHAVHKFRQEYGKEKKNGDIAFCKYLEGLVTDPAQALRVKREFGSECVAEIQWAHKTELSKRLQADDSQLKRKLKQNLRY